MRFNRIFSLLPDSGVQETLEWKTDILVSRNGSESRFSLRDLPRKKISSSFSVVDEKSRDEFVQLLHSKIKEVFVFPEWAYFSVLSQKSAQGTRRLHFDLNTVDLTVGRPVAIFNTRTRQVQISYVSEFYADGVLLLDFLEEDAPRGSLICSASEFLLEDASTLSWATVAGSASVSINSWKEYPLIRQDGVVTLPTYDGLLVLDKRPDAGVTEAFSFVRSVIDNETGLRELFSNESLSRVTLSKKYTFNRYLNYGTMDYFRNFFDAVKGNWKSFLMSSFSPDFQFTRKPVASANNIYVRGDTDLSVLLSQDAYSRIHIQYPDGTSSYHKIIASSVALQGEMSLMISPSLPSGSKVPNALCVSTLLRATMSDTVKLTHDNLQTKIEIMVRSVNE